MTGFDPDRRKVLIAGGTALTVTLAGCLGGGDGDDDGGNGGKNGGGNGGETPADIADSYLSSNNAKMYGGTDDIVDETGSDSITIDVGAGSQGLAYDPVAVRVDAGTEVTWAWTGNGGSHNVVSDDGPTELSSGNAVQGSDITYVETLDETGVYRYKCTIHTSVGMYGAVIVE